MTSCTKDTQVKTEITPPELTISDKESESPDKSTVCSDICQNKVQKLCEEEIEANKTIWTSMEESILDEANCQLLCEADFEEKIYDCFLNADSCSQFLDSAPYCMETEWDEIEPKDWTWCEKACTNYSLCTRYTEWTTEADWKDAKDSCMQICPTWTKKTTNCIASTPINKVTDCAAQTACMFSTTK